MGVSSPTTVSETVSMAHSANVTFDIKLVVLTVAQTLPAITGIDASKNVNQVLAKSDFTPKKFKNIFLRVSQRSCSNSPQILSNIFI